MLCSLNTVIKETAIVTVILRRTSPDPRLGAPVELRGSDTGGLFDLFGIGKTLASQRITPEKPPPALLQIKPARSCRDEDVMDAGMPLQPGARLQTGMTTQIVADDEQVTFGIVGFDVGQKRDVAFRIA